MEAKNRANRAGNGLDPLSQLQVPYLHCPVQQQTLMPFTMPQTRYTSSAYPDQRSVAPAAAHQVLFLLSGYIYKFVVGYSLEPVKNLLRNFLFAQPDYNKFTLGFASYYSCSLLGLLCHL